jgi:hypothetical protein
MRRQLLILICVIIAAASTAVATTFYFRLPRVQDDSGERVELSRGELAAIQSVIAARNDIPKPLTTIILHDDGHAECFSGFPIFGFRPITAYFGMTKRDGKWSVDENCFQLQDTRVSK